MLNTKPLLIEIGTEELPPENLVSLVRSFSEILQKGLENARISHGLIETFVTPRRIAVRFQDVAETQKDCIIQRKGPPIKAGLDEHQAPTQALLGFISTLGKGVTFADLQQQTTDKGTWFVYENTEKGKNLADIFPAILEQTLLQLPTPRKMRWGNLTQTFVRPIHWIVILHGETLFNFEAFGIKSRNKTHGHRFHHPESILVQHPKNYESILEQAYVIADFEKRKNVIRAEIEKKALSLDAIPVIEEKLLDTVTGLVEWPVIIAATFEKHFLTVPAEALITAMQKHQKCFALRDKNGKLLPHFILVSNTDAKPDTNIIRGNERVMRARLSDAQFFYNKDCAIPYASRVDNLRHMLFQKKLGTLYDKSVRISKLANFIALLIGENPANSEKAGLLCKADLLTDMVGEFPELQGIMGKYYALKSNETADIANAIEAHYHPRFSKDSLPETALGDIVALADKIDTLVGIFGIGLIPSGDKDPYALRRAALGILRIIIEKKYDIDLTPVIQKAIDNYGALLFDNPILTLLPFIFERFKGYQKEKAINPSVITAVLATNPTKPYDFYQRVEAVTHFLTLPEASSLAATHKRVNNILLKNNINPATLQHPDIDNTLLVEPAEKALAQHIAKLTPVVLPLIKTGAYTKALSQLAELKAPVDAFFETVMVAAEDEALKQNRLYLLLSLYHLFVNIADISALQT